MNIFRMSGFFFEEVGQYVGSEGERILYLFFINKIIQ